MCIELSEMHGAWIYHLAVLHGALLLHVVLPHILILSSAICARSLPCPPSDREEEKRDCAINRLLGLVRIIFTVCAGCARAARTNILP